MLALITLLLATPTLVSSQSVASDGVVHSHYKDVLYAVNGDGSLLWSFATGNMAAHAEGLDGVVYVAAQPNGTGGDALLYALNGTNGHKVWEFAAPCPPAQYGGKCLPTPGQNSLALPVASDGTVYLRTLGASDGTGGYSTPSTVRAVGTDGVLKWIFTMGCEDDPVTLAPDGSILLYGSKDCSDRSLSSLRADGSVKWSISGGRVIAGGRSVANDGTVYIIPQAGYPFSDNTYLAALDGGDGSVLFNISLTINSNCEPSVTKTPVLGWDGLIYVQGLQGEKESSCVLRAFHSNGTEAWAQQVALGTHLTLFDGKHNALYMVQPPSSVFALSGDAGAVLWQANVSSAGRFHLSGAAVVAGDGTIYLWDAGDDEDNSVYAVRDQAQVWKLQTGGTEYPALHEGVAYIQGWGAGMTSHGLEFYLKLFAVDRAGNVQWTFVPQSNFSIVV